MANIPEDLQRLRDFPRYDATFQDHPTFRQNLETWAGRTDKLATGLSSLADSFDHFHETGMQHFKAATSVISNLQEIATICQNDSGSTISSHILMFVDSLSKMWCYYEAFLGQTQMLNATPIRELANSFLGLKSLHEQLLQYRQEHLAAAEKLCACKHSSKLTDRSVLPTLTETCYSSQKTYQLVLSKFVLSLRQAHTVDMMSFMRRVFEFYLSKYSYHNYCTEVLKDLEPRVNHLFTQTRVWRGHYEREMKLWNKLHVSVKRNVMAEYHHNVGFLPESMEASTTWSDVAMAPITAGRQIMRPLLRMFPSQSRDVKMTNAAMLQPSEVRDWEIGEGTQRRATFANQGEAHHGGHGGEAHHGGHGGEAGGGGEGPVEEHSTVQLRRDTVGEDVTANGTALGRMKRERRRQMVRSISNPDLLSAETVDLTDTDSPAHTSNDSPSHTSNDSPAHTSNGGLPGSGEEASPTAGMMVHYLEDTTESAAEAMEEFLLRSTSRSVSHSVSSPFRPLAAVLGGIRGKARGKNGLKGKKGTKPFSSADDSVMLPEPRYFERHREGGSNPSSPQLNRKGNQPGLFRRAKGSLLNHLMSHDKSHDLYTTGEAAEVRGERSDTESLEEHALSASSDSLREAGVAGQKRKKNKKKRHASVDSERQLQPRLQISSPLTRRDWSGSELRNDELQSLVQPPPSSWAKCGFLWLRLRSESRYAWTHVWCVVDSECGEVRVQSDKDHTPQCLEKLMLCSTKLCTPDYIDRNFCFRVISPSSEHLFQALNPQEPVAWVQAFQNCTAQALKMSSGQPSLAVIEEKTSRRDGEGGGEAVPNAMSLILDIPGNRTCADCSSTVVEWASLNLGLVLCIECSGVHRGLGVHVSKVRSLNLDKWDRHSVDFMLRQGNKKANSYYAATLGTGPHETLRKPAANAAKAERSEFIQQKYVALAFVPLHTERTSSC